MQLLSVLASIASLLILVLQLAMLIRSLLPLFMRDDGPLAAFLEVLTEPIITPFRVLFDRMGWFQNTPIDAAFTAAFLCLIFLNYFLIF